MRQILTLLRGSGILLIGQVGSVIAGFLQTIVLTRYLGPSEFGVWALILAYSGLVHTFLSFRTSEALTAFWVEARINGDKSRCVLIFSNAFLAELVTKTLASLFVLGSTGLMLQWSSVEGNYWLAIELCVAGRLMAFYDPIWMSVLRDQRRLGMLSALPAATKLLQAVMNLGLFFFLSSDIVWAGVAFCIAQAVALCAKLLTTFGSLNAIFGSDGYLILEKRILRSFRALPDFWKMMSVGYFTSCLSAIPKEADTLVVGLVASEEQAGFYRIAKSLVSLVQTAVQTLSTLVIQDFSEMKTASGKDEIRGFVRSYAPLVLFFTTLVCVAGFVAAPFFIKLLYGTSFVSTTLFFRVLLIGTGFATAFFWVMPLLVVLRQLRQLLFLQIGNFVIYCVTLGFSIAIFKEMGPAIALSVAWITGHLGALYYVRRALRRDALENAA